MKICHVCKEVCEDTAELCPICGADLIDYAEENIYTPDIAAEATEDIIIKNPVILASVDDIVVSEILRDQLRENGIPFNCGDNDSSLKVTFGGAFVVDDFYVDEDNLDKALEIYEGIINYEPEFDEEFFDETENS